jgi:hypothetical protein
MNSRFPICDSRVMPQIESSIVNPDLCKTPNLNGARSIAPHEMPASCAEQCSALRRPGGGLQKSQIINRKCLCTDFI